jgi:Na+/H+ antiporter NhaA
MVKILHACVLLTLQIEWILMLNSVVWYALVSVIMMMCMPVDGNTKKLKSYV